jgi:hypothetical protein
MAYDEYLADRITQILNSKKVAFEAQKMMGGLCYMVDDKMCCGIHFDKKKNMDLLMARIGAPASIEALQRNGCHPMDFTGRPMKDYVFVSSEGFDLDSDLEHWIGLCLTFNPIAMSSKKKS